MHVNWKGKHLDNAAVVFLLVLLVTSKHRAQGLNCLRIRCIQNIVTSFNTSAYWINSLPHLNKMYGQSMDKILLSTCIVSVILLAIKSTAQNNHHNNAYKSDKNLLVA